MRGSRRPDQRVQHEKRVTPADRLKPPSIKLYGPTGQSANRLCSGGNPDGGLVQRLRDVRNNIIRMFDANRKTDVPGGYAC